jgi:DNA primase
LVDVVWEMETQGRAMDTPERRASVEAALKQRVDDIADATVRGYYYEEIVRRRLWEARRVRPASGVAHAGRAVAQRPGPSRPMAGRQRSEPGPSPWFADGAALRNAAHDLDPGRRERVLLGAVLARPAWLHVLAEDMVDLPLQRPDMQRVRMILLDVAALDLVADEAAGQGVQEVEARAAAMRMEQAGLAATAAALRREAEIWLGVADPEAALAQWRHIADRHRAAVIEDAERRAAAADLANAPAEENFQQSQALIERTLRSAKSGSEG